MSSLKTLDFATKETRCFCPTGEDVFAPQEQDVFAPQAQDVFAPKAQDVFAPQAQDVFAPQAQDVFAPQAQDVFAPEEQDVYSPPFPERLRSVRSAMSLLNGARSSVDGKTINILLLRSRESQTLRSYPGLNIKHENVSTRRERDSPRDP